MVSVQVLAMPKIGRARSASEKPIALKYERAGARSRPSRRVWLLWRGSSDMGAHRSVAWSRGEARGAACPPRPPYYEEYVAASRVVTLRIEPELFAQLRAAAKAERRSVSAQIRFLVRRELEAWPRRREKRNGGSRHYSWCRACTTRWPQDGGPTLSASSAFCSATIARTLSDS